jgi:hypothetical protein
MGWILALLVGVLLTALLSAAVILVVLIFLALLATLLLLLSGLLTSFLLILLTGTLLALVAILVVGHCAVPFCGENPSKDSTNGRNQRSPLKQHVISCRLKLGHAPPSPDGACGQFLATVC